MTDPIADMLTRIRNAVAVNKTEVRLPYSKLKQAVAKALKKGGYLTAVQTEGGNIEKELVLQLASSEQASSTITEIHRISRPGQRIYTASSNIPRILRGRGIVVISTSKGVMSGEEARQSSLGGELMCKVW